MHVVSKSLNGPNRSYSSSVTSTLIVAFALNIRAVLEVAVFVSLALLVRGATLATKIQQGDENQ